MGSGRGVGLEARREMAARRRAARADAEGSEGERNSAALMAASSSSIGGDAAGAEGDRDPPRRESGESSEIFIEFSNGFRGKTMRPDSDIYIYI